MEQKMREIRADDINPRFNWGRALPALGTMGVDFEERVDYRRLAQTRRDVLPSGLVPASRELAAVPQSDSSTV